MALAFPESGRRPHLQRIPLLELISGAENLLRCLYLRYRLTDIALIPRLVLRDLDIRSGGLVGCLVGTRRLLPTAAASFQTRAPSAICEQPLTRPLPRIGCMSARLPTSVSGQDLFPRRLQIDELWI